MKLFETQPAYVNFLPSFKPIFLVGMFLIQNKYMVRMTVADFSLSQWERGGSYLENIENRLP